MIYSLSYMPNDLKKQSRLWEDVYDRALAKQLALESRESIEGEITKGLERLLTEIES